MNFKQVIVVRKDLNISRGKEIAQACHASRGAAELSRKDYNKNNDKPVYTTWIMQGETKIVVGVDTKEELFELFKEVNEDRDIPAKLVRDHGHTELETGTMTAAGFGPAEAEKIDEYTSHLKLL